MVAFWICSPSSDIYFIFLEMLICQKPYMDGQGKAAGLNPVQTTDLSLVTMNHRLPRGSNNNKKKAFRKSVLSKSAVTRRV